MKSPILTREALLLQGLQALQINASDRQQAALLSFVDLLDKWNRIYNLTAVKGAEQMITRHLLDSLALLPYLSSLQAERVLDIGTGAGLPVLPLAMLAPDVGFVSVESNGKKARFQRQAILQLRLANVSVYEERIQGLVTQVDLVMARAFAAPENFLALAAARCRSGGHAFVMLGRSERLPDPVPSPWQLLGVQALEVPGLDAQRHLAICRRD